MEKGIGELSYISRNNVLLKILFKVDFLRCAFLKGEVYFFKNAVVIVSWLIFATAVKI